MLRCNSPSSSELKEISEEKSEESDETEEVEAASEEVEAASETEDSPAQASEVAGVEEGWSVLIGSNGFDVSSASELIAELIGKGSSTSELSSRRTAKPEEKGSEGEALETESCV